MVSNFAGMGKLFPTKRGSSTFPVPGYDFHVLNEDWVKRYNWEIEPNTGPYVIAEVRKGKYIDIRRKDNWWGDNLKYYKNRFNPERIRVRVIRDVNTAWQHCLKGELDAFGLVLPQFWHEKAQGEPFWYAGQFVALLRLSTSP